MTRKVLLLAITVPVLLCAQTVDMTILQGKMSPTSENPPVVTTAVGYGEAAFHTRRGTNGTLTSATIDFHVTYYLGQAETLTGMHIHRGAAGANGPIVLDPRFERTPVPAGNGVIFKQMTVTDPAQLEIVQQVLDNPAGFYMNVHAATAPGGIMRAQLRRTLDAMVTSSQTQSNTRLESIEKGVEFIQLTITAIARRLGIVPGQ